MNTQDKIQVIEEKIKSLLNEIDREKGISKTAHYNTLLNVYLKKREQLKCELDVEKALKDLGKKGNFSIKSIVDDRVMVFVNDEYFGIWDVIRKTFVD